MGKRKTISKKEIINYLKDIDSKFNPENKIFFFRASSSKPCSKCILSFTFDEALILTADGVGEWATTTF